MFVCVYLFFLFLFLFATVKVNEVVQSSVRSTVKEQNPVGYKEDLRCAKNFAEDDGDLL